jgi:hypothetical protein
LDSNTAAFVAWHAHRFFFKKKTELKRLKNYEMKKYRNALVVTSTVVFEEEYSYTSCFLGKQI